MKTLADLAEAGEILTMVPIAPLTTYKVGGPARFFLEADTEEQLAATAASLGDEPLLVLGRGSNLIVSDDGFPGLVVRLGPGFHRIEFGEGGTVRSGAATPMPALARTCARAGRGGLEFLVGIPGSVGGAVRMNAGCHGSETADVLRTAAVFNLSDGSESHRSPDQLELEYRHSNLGDLEVVTSARFETTQVDPETSEAELRDVSRWRKENQPGGTLNAGSVFKNPPGEAAGRIIDEAGLKGFRVGRVSVSMKHANFFVAEKDATAQDVHDLVTAVRDIVLERSGLTLVPEIRFVGEFEAESE